MSAIFISHSSADAQDAADVAHWLTSKGHRSLFLDFDPQFGIPAGRSWEQELYSQITSSRAVIVLWSWSARASRWCFAEITQARSLGKTVVFLCLDDCPVDEVFGSTQVVALSDGRSQAFSRLWRGLLSAGVDPANLFDWDGSRPPYPGLLAFQMEDAAVFFGRDGPLNASIELLNKMHRLDGARLLLVIGSSGSGKSSLVRAGILPRLLRDPARWIVLDPLRPRDDPLRALASALDSASACLPGYSSRWSRDAIYSALTDGSWPVNPLNRFARELQIAAGRPDARLLVTVDQVEELLSLPPEHPSTAFMNLLRDALQAVNGTVTVLGTLRSDFLSDFHGPAPLSGVRFESVLVPQLSAGDVAQVVEGPPRVAGLRLETGLAQLLVADTAGEDALPLLAFTLRQLYDNFGGDGELTVDEYHARLGGLHGALARVADELVTNEELSFGEENQLRLALLSMVRLTEDDRWVRRSVNWEELPAPIRPTLERFVAARLLVVGSSGGDRTVEIAHEALFRAWRRMAQWLEQSTAEMRLLRDIHRAARDWNSAGHDNAELWSGGKLLQAEEFAAAGNLTLEPAGRAFLEASRQAEIERRHREEMRRKRRLRTAVGVAAVASLLAAAALVAFVSARRESDRANRQAQQLAALAAASASREILSQNPALAMAVANEAMDMTPSPLPPATEALVAAQIRFANRSGTPLGGPLTGHRGEVATMRFSEDGRLLATGGEDRSVRLWDTATQTLYGRPLVGHTGALLDLGFGTSSDRLVSASEDGTVRTWRVDTGEQIGDAVVFNTTPVTEALLSTNLKRLAFREENGPIRLWDLTRRAPVGEPLVDGDKVDWFVFAPRGNLLAGVDVDGSLRVWDAETGVAIGSPKPVATMLDENGLPESGQPEWFWVGFGPDGRTIALANSQGALALWEPRTDRSSSLDTGLGDLPAGSRHLVQYVQFSDDGTRAVSLADESSVRMWAESDVTVREPLPGLDRFVDLLALSGDGRLLGTMSGGNLRLWRVDASDASWHPVDSLSELPPASVAFSPDGTQMASIGADKVLQVRDAKTFAVLDQHRLPGLWTLVYTPEGTLLTVEAQNGDLIQLRNAATGESVGRGLIGGGSALFGAGVAFSSDGQLVATAANDGKVRIWDRTAEWTLLRTINAHKGDANSVNFSPENTRLISAGDDGMVRVWEVESGTAIGVDIDGAHGAIDSAAFSPDGNLIASVGADGVVRLWDGQTGAPAGELGGSGAEGLAFSHDGRLIATVRNGAPWLWAGLGDTEQRCSVISSHVPVSAIATHLPPGYQPHACDRE